MLQLFDDQPIWNFAKRIFNDFLGEPTVVMLLSLNKLKEQLPILAWTINRTVFIFGNRLKNWSKRCKRINDLTSFHSAKVRFSKIFVG